METNKQYLLNESVNWKKGTYTMANQKNIKKKNIRKFTDLS
jgi:hypothetical protein